MMGKEERSPHRLAHDKIASSRIHPSKTRGLRLALGAFGVVLTNAQMRIKR